MPFAIAAVSVIVLYVSPFAGAVAGKEVAWGLETESVIGVFWDAAALPSPVNGPAPCWWHCLRAPAAFFAVAAALLPLRRGIALAGLCPLCFQFLGFYSSPACCLAGQFAFGTLMVIRWFFIGGMFALKWICQVVAREFVHAGKFGS